MVVRQRKRSQKVVEADKQLLERIEPIKSEHPAWGYRRVWSYLKYRLDIPVGKNRIYRILKENRLLAMNRRKLKALRSSRYSKPSTDTPNELWGIDMTRVKVDSWGWLYLVVVKDWGSKKIVGWSLSTTSKTRDWLNALEQAVNDQFPEGIREYGSLRLVSDNGCQPSSSNFMAACRLLGIKQIFTSFNNPKGNADTERVFLTLKEDLIWFQEWYSYEQLFTALERWIAQYNGDYPHSEINQLTPQQYEQQFNPSNNNQYSLK